MKKGLIIFSTFLTQLINYALADETIKLENLKTHNEPTFFGAVFSLIAVLGLIYLVSFLYQKLTVFNEKITNKENLEANKFKIVSTTPIGQGKFLHVVEINNKFLALGSTPNNISFLREFSKEEVESINETN